MAAASEPSRAARHFFKESPSFFCGLTPSKTLAAPQTLNIGPRKGGIQEGRGRWGGGKKKEKKDAPKSAQKMVSTKRGLTERISS